MYTTKSLWIEDCYKVGGRSIFGSFFQGMLLDNDQSSGWSSGVWYMEATSQNAMIRHWLTPILFLLKTTIWSAKKATFPRLLRWRVMASTAISHRMLHNDSPWATQLAWSGAPWGTQFSGCGTTCWSWPIWCCSVVKTHMFNSLSIKSIHIP